MSYIIYVLLCAVNGIVLATADINPMNWQFWVITLCVCGAYLCGKENSN